MMGHDKFFRLLLGRVMTIQGPCSCPASEAATTKCFRRSFQKFCSGQKIEKGFLDSKGLLIWEHTTDRHPSPEVLGHLSR
jgi:hypothetical protein